MDAIFVTQCSKKERVFKKEQICWPHAQAQYQENTLSDKSVVPFLHHIFFCLMKTEYIFLLTHSQNCFFSAGPCMIAKSPIASPHTHTHTHIWRTQYKTEIHGLIIIIKIVHTINLMYMEESTTCKKNCKSRLFPVFLLSYCTLLSSSSYNDEV